MSCLTIGYEQTTMDAIAEQAERVRGTVFKYFPDRIIVVAAIYERLYVEGVHPQVKEYLVIPIRSRWTPCTFSSPRSMSRSFNFLRSGVNFRPCSSQC